MDIHKEFPKTVDRDDFWRQIKRTVNGEPVSEESIQMIVSAIQSSLKLSKVKSQLLDLGCGNAALASRLFGFVKSYTGVDFSDYLIGVAKEFFFEPVVEDYIATDIISFMEQESRPERFSEVLCYGVMAYLSRQDLKSLFELMYTRFPNVERVFLGNVPDATKADKFYAQREVKEFDLDDHLSPIGVWWKPEELEGLASLTNWVAEIRRMPDNFYAAEYRFDLLLKRCR